MAVIWEKVVDKIKKFAVITKKSRIKSNLRGYNEKVADKTYSFMLQGGINEPRSEVEKEYL